jgi:hypothetical protein
MADITLKVQNVNGDPASTGGNINIVTGPPVEVVFNEAGSPPNLAVAPGDTITVDGVVYTYAYLGTGDVRGDADQTGAFIRLTGSSDPSAPLPVGTTYAIDLDGSPDDPDYPNLQNGNTKLEVSDLDGTGGGGGAPPFPCFTPGTRIETPDGPRAIETLVVGDLVLTLDHGPQPIRWIGRRRLCADRDLSPIVFAPGVLGNRRRLAVSPCHRILVTGWRAEMICGRDEMLVAAKHFLDMDGVYRAPPGPVVYMHLLCDRHEILFAEGQATESLHCQQDSLSLVDPEGQAEILRIFPELGQGSLPAAPTCRPCARGHEARVLLA